MLVVDECHLLDLLTLEDLGLLTNADFDLPSRLQAVAFRQLTRGCRADRPAA